MFSVNHTNFVGAMLPGRPVEAPVVAKPTGDSIAPRISARRNGLKVVMLLLTITLAAPTWALVITEDTTLTTDLFEPITFAADNVVLDGNGHTITVFGGQRAVGVEGRSGITVKNLKIVSLETVGILVRRSSKIAIDNVEVLLTSDVGILIDSSEGVTVVENTITGGLGGIVVLRESEGITVVGNTITGGLGGIVARAEGSLIASNTCISQSVGICVDGAEGSLIASNTCIDSRRFGIFVLGSDGNALEDNVLEYNLVGVRLERSDANDLLENTVNFNDVGIELFESDMNSVRFNTLEANGECIVEIDSTGNRFVLNECIP